MLRLLIYLITDRKKYLLLPTYLPTSPFSRIFCRQSGRVVFIIYHLFIYLKIFSIRIIEESLIIYIFKLAKNTTKLSSLRYNVNKSRIPRSDRLSVSVLPWCQSVQSDSRRTNTCATRYSVFISTYLHFSQAYWSLSLLGSRRSLFVFITLARL